jgi:hypothetical protein
MNDYPSNWNMLRSQVYERDNYSCQNCGIKGGSGGEVELHAHHIVPLSRGGNNILSNLTTLCESCHGNIHPHLRDDSEQYSEESPANSTPSDKIESDSTESTSTPGQSLHKRLMGVTQEELESNLDNNEDSSVNDNKQDSSGLKRFTDDDDDDDGSYRYESKANKLDGQKRAEENRASYL